MKDSGKKTNRLAIVSVISGLTALLSLGFYWALFLIAFPTSPGASPGIANQTLITIMDLTVPVRNLCAPAAFLTGILALRDIKKKEGLEKGKFLAWTGMVLGVAWILVGVLVGITFFLAEILN